MSERYAHMTERQREAIRTVDRSVLVSAAAGSGKTTVLAERCASLICDPPADRRCRVDELLVVTFTDAAAGEMRSRIAAAIRKRIAESPHNGYLRMQLHLLDAASISTIHSFCRTLIQRWFPQANVDPQATVLSGDEAELLRDEVLDDLFRELYTPDAADGQAFQDMVDAYGVGDDAKIAEVVRQIHDFVSSLPDPEGWLASAVRGVEPGQAESLMARLDDVQRARIDAELRIQVEYAEQVAERIRHCWPAAASRAGEVEQVRDVLQGWRKQLAAMKGAEWESPARTIGEHDFGRVQAKPRNLSEEDSRAFDAARDMLNEVKGLCTSRLKNSICRFTAAEYREGLERIAPHTRTLARLVQEFDRRYAAAKREQAAIDFNDLQRFAYRLLAEGGDASRPSEVARQVQRQYRYVLVDEFQDVDPLQEAILRLVSRESSDPPRGNLFTVGDIKQSIYRFRLAEPTLFARRAARFRAGEESVQPGDGATARGKVIDLQENFRSRQSVVDAVNLVFRPLMSEQFGGSAYDDAAELHAGASFPSTGGQPVFDKPAVEVHVLEPVTEVTRPEESDSEESGGSGDDELAGIEREGFLVGQRIHAWMATNGGAPMHVADRPKVPGGEPTLRPIRYRDIVVLLRSLPHKAEPIAGVLRRMGIPVQLEKSDDSLDSTEFRDVYSLLQLLDNEQQDLPLAAVLRSPLLGDAFNESDLLRIRLFDRGAAFFHEAVTRYAREGPEEDLRERLKTVLARLARYRERMRRAPVAEVLWEILQETEYPAFVSGLPDGVRRREHLLRLHELARQFGQFARQGLRRFLRYLEDAVASERPPQQPSGAGADEDVVRIMTIHASKGLEFPVVILADACKAFNLADCRGPVLIDRELGIGMQAADPERRILYPTLAHQLASENARSETLSEELRVFYVALTRAREHLVVVGRERPEAVKTCRAMASAAGRASRVPELELRTASSMMDWLLPAMAAAPVGVVDWGDGRPEGGSLFQVRTYSRVDTDAWRIPRATAEDHADFLAGIAALNPLSQDEPVGRGAAIDEIIGGLASVYPALPLTTLPARVSVSELKRRWEAGLEADERPAAWSQGARRQDGGVGSAHTSEEARARGTATHRFLQLVDLAGSCDAKGLAAQLAGLGDSGRMTQEEVSAVILHAAEWFFQTPLGQRLREGRNSVRREVAFVSRIRPEEYDPMVEGRDGHDVLLLRGMVDAVLLGDEGLEIIDYKTDAVDAKGCAERAESYRTQVDSYARAMQGIYQRRVLKRWLVFLDARHIVDLSG